MSASAALAAFARELAQVPQPEPLVSRCRLCGVSLAKRQARYCPACRRMARNAGDRARRRRKQGQPGLAIGVRVGGRR